MSPQHRKFMENLSEIVKFPNRNAIPMSNCESFTARLFVVKDLPWRSWRSTSFD